MSKKEKKKNSCKPLVKRMAISISLALLFGLLCSYLAWNSDATLRASTDYWGSPLMLNIMFNRLLIGFVIVFAGFMKTHPILGIRMYPVLRGALIGALVSIDMIFGPFIMGYEQAALVARMTILAGALYGMIIDVVATKFSAEGVDLYEGIK